MQRKKTTLKTPQFRKIGKGLEQMFTKKRYTKWQKTHEKMFNISH